MISFQKRRITVSTTVVILAFSSIIFLLSACVVTAVGEPYHSQDPPARRGDFGSIQGLWFITAANFSGKLEFHWERGLWVGRVWFDALQRWEPLSDILFDPHTGETQFTRVSVNQRYTGSLSGNQILGTYTGLQGESGSWAATREAIRPGPVDFREIQGPWFITAANFSGKLEFHWEKGLWVGRVWFDALQRWEPLSDIFFDPHTREIQFTRVSVNQRYTGSLSGNQILGTYTGLQGESGSWAARRP